MSEPQTRAPGDLLRRISSPADLKALPREDLPALCEEIRGFLLESIQHTGGHLGSNLGVVELTVALHTVFDFRFDRIVWDVSHLWISVTTLESSLITVNGSME